MTGWKAKSMFGKYIPCRGRRRDAAITKLDAKDIMNHLHIACLYDADGLSIFIHELLACRRKRGRERVSCNGGELGCKFG